MIDYRLADMESKFADLIWDNEPLTSGELVRLSEKALSWKKSTTYTILKRLCNRGIFKSEDGEPESVYEPASDTEEVPQATGVFLWPLHGVRADGSFANPLVYFNNYQLSSAEG